MFSAVLPGFFVQAVGTGQAHTCVLSTDGRVSCWGDNRFGQVGAGSDFSIIIANGTVSPPPVVDLGVGVNAAAIAVGAFHSCALLSSGGVKCWGDNEYGQLGQGDLHNRGGSGEMGDVLPTVAVGHSRTVTAVAAGAFHTCALLDDSSVKCWGANISGQLGIGSSENKGGNRADLGDGLAAAALGNGRAVTAIAAGGTHTCALFLDGTVTCWGGGLFGQRGDGSVSSLGGVPTPALADAAPIELGTVGASAVAASALGAGANHTCALLMTGDVKCWGLNNVGQLGQESTVTLGDGPMEMGNNLPPIRLGTAPSP
jgi:alpha-tubulin suppressor-like RCC1 family protein